MNDQNTATIIDRPSFFIRHSFILFIIISIIISFIVVVVSMIMYNSSGAAQLDLSRPGYVDVRSQVVVNEGDFQSYSSTGAINKDSINDFKSLYDKQAQKVKAADAFGGDPLSSDALGIGTLQDN